MKIQRDCRRADRNVQKKPFQQQRKPRSSRLARSGPQAGRAHDGAGWKVQAECIGPV
jgi:hypothetical protein